MVRTLETAPEFENTALNDLSRGQENRLIAAAAAFIAVGTDVDALPPEISTMLGVGVRRRHGENSPSRIRRRLYAMLRHVDEPRVRWMVIRFGLHALQHLDVPGPDDLFEPLAADGSRPNLGIAFEALLGALKPGTSSIVVHDPKKGGRVTMKPTGDGHYFAIATSAGGRGGRRRKWSVFQSFLDGSLPLHDPDGRHLVRSDGIGSLHAPNQAQAGWRAGAGPAAGMSADAILEVLKEYGDCTTGAGEHISAVLAVSADGWIHASSLADVRETNDAAKLRRCFEGAHAVRPVFVCLLDATDGGGSGWPLIAYASTDGNGVVDLGAGRRRDDIGAIFPGHPQEGWPDSRRASVAISVARAQAFAEAAKGLLR
jgi:hypothetical protein